MTGRRILLLSTSIARGGAERQVVDLAIALRRRGWAVGVLSMIEPTDHHEELAAAGIGLRSLEMNRGRPSLRGLARYVRLVRRWRPAIVHAHMVHANLLARIGHVLVPSVPVISTVHNVVEGPRWRELAYRATDRLSATTTAVSSAATERYIRVGATPPGRILTIPNGVDLTPPTLPHESRSAVRSALGATDSFLWLNVARLMPAKGHDILLRAFREVVNADAATRLVIAGDGPERDPLVRLRDELELTDKVVLLGERRDVPALLGAADAFVLSSRWEGLPMVLLEAAARALPIVATDVGGCREVASPDAGAILTTATPDDVGRGMVAMMGLDDTERASIGSNLRKHVEASYSLAAIVDRWEALYASVVDGQPFRAPVARSRH